MKFINSSVNEIVENNPYKLVERIGRMCYKSEDKISDTSYIKFVNMLINHKHFAMLEHGWITFKIDIKGAQDIELLDTIGALSYYPYVVTDSLDKNTYIFTVSLSHLYNPRYKDSKLLSVFMDIAEMEYFNRDFEFVDDWQPLISIIDPLDLPIEMQERHMHKSIHFICDRGVSHELVRHRCAAAQESTRYCNYSKDKFGKELTFIYPSTWTDWEDCIKSKYCQNLNIIEMLYNDMVVKHNMSPEQARCILPNSLKTEVVLTMSEEQWCHFIAIRYKGTTGKPHPDMIKVAKEVYDIIMV